MAGKGGAKRPARTSVARVGKLSTEGEKTRIAIDHVRSRDKLSSKLDEAVEILNDAVRHGLQRYVHLGLLAAEIRDDDGRVYGDRAFVLLAQALGQHKSQLLKAMQFVDLYSTEQINDMLERTNGFGQTVSFSHIVPLLPIKNDALREDLLEAFYRRNLTTRELEAEIAKRTAADERMAAGAARPKSLTGGFTRLLSMSRSFRRTLEDDLGSGLFDRLDRLGTDSVDVSLLHRIIDSRAELEGLVNMVNDRLKFLLAKEEKITTMLGVEGEGRG